MLCFCDISSGAVQGGPPRGSMRALAMDPQFRDLRKCPGTFPGSESGARVDDAGLVRAKALPKVH
eukprot:720859-Pyramimonas_sp.AAC.1